MRLFYCVICILVFTTCKHSAHLNFDAAQYSVSYSLIDSPQLTPFKALILYYTPAYTACGNRAFASMASCITANDSLLIFSLCNQDTTYHIGDTIWVTPHAKPPFHVDLPSPIYTYGLPFDPNMVTSSDPGNIPKAMYGEIKHLN